MNRNLFLKELKLNRKNLLIWLVVILFFTIFVAAFFPSIQQMGGALDEMMRGLPEGMVRALGMDINTWQSFLGYYSTYYGMHITILSSIFVITIAGNILSKEEREGTADFLLARPVTRTDVVVTKMMSFFVLYLLFLGIQIAAAVAGIHIFSDADIEWSRFMILNAYGIMLHLFFGGIGFIISLLPRKGKSVTGLVIGIVVGSYFIDALSKISDDSKWMGWFSPFRYADFEVTALHYEIELWRVAILIGLALIFFAGTFWIYKRKDIY